MGIGDFGEVSRGSGRTRNPTSRNDIRGAGRKLDADLVDGRRDTECGATTEPCWHRVGIGDGAWGQAGSCNLYWAGPRGAYGMRVDRVGVRDVGTVHGRARSARYSTSGDDSRRARQQRDADLVGGHWDSERDAASEPCWNRIGFRDRAWGKHGACDVHWEGSGGPHRMRGHRVGVGDVGEVSGRTRGTGDSASGDDGGGARRKRDPGLVGGNRVAERDASGE